MSCCNCTPSPCGPFTDPTVPDLGQCFPYREQQTCEVPTLPTPECLDDDFTVVYDYTKIPYFRIIAKLRDVDCNLILDENGAEILTNIT